MKLHRNTTEAVVRALDMIFVQRKYADKVIEKVLKENSRWGARDRRFIAETTYNIVRWYRLLQEVTAARQHDFWTLLAGHLILQNVALPGWDEFSDFRADKVRERLTEQQGIRKVIQSVPDWLDELGERELGDRWNVELPALNEEAKVILRVNTLKTTRESLMERLGEEGVETTMAEDFSDALIVNERQNMFATMSFKEGLFEVQDAASQLIAPFLDAAPGMRVVDACAGAGGKTLHIAARMKNKGRIIAMDVEQWKLDELQKRARRAGVSNMEARLIDSSKVIKRLENSADRLLLDVPCSGLGVLKRNPDAKWKLSTGFLEEVKELQQSIITDYSAMLKPGGLMVYATCSILPSENEHQVKAFLQKKQNFELIEQKHTWPSEGFDGFYMARIRRVDS